MPPFFFFLQSVWCLPFPFFILFPIINIYNKYVLEHRFEFPTSATLWFVVWCLLHCVKQVVLRNSRAGYAQFDVLYIHEWDKLKENAYNKVLIRDLEDIIHGILKLPSVSLYSNTCAQRVGTPHLYEGRAQGPSFFPCEMHRDTNVLNKAYQLIFGQRGDSYILSSQACLSLDNIYAQAYMMVPIFNLKVKQLGIAANAQLLTCNSEGEKVLASAQEVEIDSKLICKHTKIYCK